MARKTHSAGQFAGALLIIVVGVVIGGLLVAAGQLADEPQASANAGLGFVLAGFLVAGLGIASGLLRLTRPFAVHDER